MELNPSDSAISVGLENYYSNNSKAPTPPQAIMPMLNATPPPRSEEEQAAQNQEIIESFVQASTAITVDSPPRDDEFDDGYETDSIGSATTSISSSATDFQYENGRRYHKFREGSYYFPNDASEQDREDLKHATMVRLLQKIHFAPIGENPQQILDLGTGTGIWAIEMGDEFPGATIRGVDLSPIQPEWVPPNVKFIVDDFESQWLYDDNFFDYIHTRHTVMAVRDWDKLYSQAFKHLKPGGWMESQEIVHLPQCSDGSMPPDWPIIEYWNLITAALAKSNVNFSSAPLLAQKMANAGFTNVTEQILHVPIGPWARNKWLKMVGVFWRTVLFDGSSAIALRPLTRMGWSMQEVEVWLVQIRKAYLDDSVHAWMPLYLVQGQKPLDGKPANSFYQDIQSNNPHFQPTSTFTPQNPRQQPGPYSQMGSSSSQMASSSSNIGSATSYMGSQSSTHSQAMPNPHQTQSNFHSQNQQPQYDQGGTIPSPMDTRPDINMSSAQQPQKYDSHSFPRTQSPVQQSTDIEMHMHSPELPQTFTNPRKHLRQDSEDEAGPWGH